MPNQTPYEVLGVKPDATPEEIRSQYRLLVRQYHPDRVEEGLRETATTLFRSIQAAYDTLNDPALRTAYETSQGQGMVSPRADTTYTTKSDLRDTTENVVCVHCHKSIGDTSEGCFGSNGQPYHIRCLREIRKQKPIAAPLPVETVATQGEVITKTKNRFKPSLVEFFPVVVWVLVFCLTFYLVVVNARDITELKMAFVLSFLIATLAALFVPGLWRLRTNSLIDKTVVALSLCITLVPTALTVDIWYSGKIQVKYDAFIFRKKFNDFCGRADESNLQTSIRELRQKAKEEAKKKVEEAKRILIPNLNDGESAQQPNDQQKIIVPINN
uniref:J domain-containing protein n=1 Tax=Armatimonas sp. TaxID=1872638 RepID=UPI003753990D